MHDLGDPFRLHILEAEKQMRRDDALRHQAVGRAMSAYDVGAQLRASTENTGHNLVQQMRRDDALRHQAVDRAMSAYDVGEQMRFLTGDPGHKLIEQMRRDDALHREAILGQARETANLAQALALPTAIERFRTQIEPLADKLLHLPSLDWVRQPEYLAVFNHTSAVADFLEERGRVDRELRDATHAFGITALPRFDSLAGYRHLLDAAGLILPRWPRFRLLSFAEKRRRLRGRLKQNAEPGHVRRAKSLVHQYELTLRSILDGVMAQSYGEDWPQQRLPLCNCRDLLGRWKNRGGDVLDHADYAHYARIMSHPEHFEAVFQMGFDDPQAVEGLLTRAGRLRARSHHPHKFTPEDLRDLRLIWRTIEIGLVALTPDYEIESWG